MINGILNTVFGIRGPYDNLLMIIESPVNKLFSMDGEFTDETSNKKVLMIKTTINEIDIAFTHSAITLYV